MVNGADKLDLRNANQIFTAAWSELKKQYGRENLCFPKEIMWLGGAPGSGKGTNTPFILRERGLTADPIVMSALLDTPAMQELKDRGHLVGDYDAVKVLLEELLKEEYESGAVVDGFPRTKVQVECVRLLYQKMLELRKEFFDAPTGPSFRRPIFRITVLYVTEQVSIDRQLSRGQKIQAHNEEVKTTGSGELQELRPTDLDPELARGRYRVFKEHTLDALQGLRDIFHYHFVDANGAIASIEKKITADFQYQSSLELDEDTYDTIRNIPLATSIALHARQELVRRLDNYRHRHSELFGRVSKVVEEEIVPVLLLHAAVGRAKVSLENTLLGQTHALEMAVDILTERGFYPSISKADQLIPMRVDSETGAIINASRRLWMFEILFTSSQIRRGAN